MKKRDYLIICLGVTFVTVFSIVFFVNSIISGDIMWFFGFLSALGIYSTLFCLYNFTEKLRDNSVQTEKQFKSLSLVKNNNVKEFLIEEIEKDLRAQYPSDDAWRTPSGIADTMACVGYAMYKLDNEKRRVASLTDAEAEKELELLKDKRKHI